MYRVALNTAISLYRKSSKRVKTQDISELAFKIESIGEGWLEHTNVNHNVKKYLKFLVFISQKKIDDCSSLEKHIKLSLKDKDYSFIPY